MGGTTEIFERRDRIESRRVEQPLVGDAAQAADEKCRLGARDYLLADRAVATALVDIGGESALKPSWNFANRCLSASSGPMASNISAYNTGNAR